ncbi:MAG: tetratricopeptide repeat protein [Mariprofundales bacterium]
MNFIISYGLRVFCGLLFLLSLTSCVAVSKHTPHEKAMLHYRLGTNALANKNLPKAFKELLRAESLEKTNIKILDALGLAWRMRGELTKSEEYYTKAMRYNPSSSTHNNYGSLLLQMKRAQDAELQFRLSLNDPRYEKADIAAINLGDALLMQRRWQDALRSYKQAKLLNSQQNISDLKKANVYFLMRDYKQAQYMYQQLLNKHPDSRPVMANMLILLEIINKFSDASQLLMTFLDATHNQNDRVWAEQQLLRLLRK